METRMITEIKIYKLILNPMRGNIENSTIVGFSYEKNKLIDWYISLLIPEGYKEEGSPSFECHGDSHTWHKSFKQGSELEWFNPCEDFIPNHFGHGISEEWVSEQAIQNSQIKIII